MSTAVLDTKGQVIEQAKSLTVKSISDRQLAANLWDAIRAFRKQEEEEKETHCRPLKTAWDNAKAGHDVFIKECQGHESRLQVLMSAWDREQDRLARVEQERLQAIIDKKNEKIIAKAEEKGIEPVLKQAPVVQAPAKSIETQAGTKQTRSVKKVYGIKTVGGENPTEWTAQHQSVAQLLKDFPHIFVLDNVKFNKLAATGMLDSHPCIEIREEYVYSQRG